MGRGRSDWTHGHTAVVGATVALGAWSYRPWLLLLAAFASGYVVRGVREHLLNAARYVGTHAFRSRREW